ncbi:hypothetical protein GGF32_004634 [Allomyces javanicus]|nr:hypothetical protein GGF32_004634 [Allomyces javanicus]
MDPMNMKMSCPAPTWYAAQAMGADVTTAGDHSAIVEAIGYVSGGILGTFPDAEKAICLVPQIYQVWKTRSAEDISYWWSFLYFLGTVYMVLVNAVAGWVSGAIETVMLFVLVGIKWWYDRRARLAGEGGEEVEAAAMATVVAPSVRSHRSSSKSTVKYPGRVLYAVVDRIEDDEDVTTVHSGNV